MPNSMSPPTACRSGGAPTSAKRFAHAEWHRALQRQPGLVAVVRRRAAFCAGTDSGIYRWDAGGAAVGASAVADGCQMVTALASPPDNPDVILAGTQPVALYRSEDGAQSWARLEVPIKPYVSSGFRKDPAFAGAKRRSGRWRGIGRA